MKKKTGCMTLFFNFLLFTGYSFALPSNGLVATLKFNGNARDSSGNNHHGEVNGAVLTTDRFGHRESAYEFDGKSSIQVKAPSLHDSDLTVAAWINVFSRAQSGMEIIGQPGDEQSIRYMLSTKKSRASEKFNIYAENPGGDVVDVAGTTTPIRNQWYHVVQTYDGEFLRLYINGYTESVIPYKRGEGGNVSPMKLLRIGYGISKKHDAAGFIGKIDDVYIYRRALTETEIRTLYAAVPGMVSEPPLLLLFALGLFGIIYFKRKPSHPRKKANNDLLRTLNRRKIEP